MIHLIGAWKFISTTYSDVAFLQYASHVTVPEMRSDWQVKIVQYSTKDSAQVRQSELSPSQSL